MRVYGAVFIPHHPPTRRHDVYDSGWLNKRITLAVIEKNWEPFYLRMRDHSGWFYIIDKKDADLVTNKTILYII